MDLRGGGDCAEYGEYRDEGASHRFFQED
jgi:hypothetical protein